ncbi:hypothetical protein I553_2176 [Mycobacterium xenopi 4042]|uniref:Uncharacterized protein n=1 Tax=Mycobacterium xenopi 4042 TaxID=1299334 RepID=X8DMP1_MYCXE|nr:hypothetical protein I552_7065 [Mycobacterium xenopi 3993]EUA68988.1 hypothetical protein I553_2176 [Mycobacterium xenopi 4042]
MAISFSGGEESLRRSRGFRHRRHGKPGVIALLIGLSRCG